MHAVFAGFIPQLVTKVGLASTKKRLCCASAVKDSRWESSVVAGLHEQTEAPDLPHHELA